MLSCYQADLCQTHLMLSCIVRCSCSLQDFSEAELSVSGGPLRVQVDNEMKRREQLLDIRQRLAQEVTQKSKVAGW